ncbi:hypothetical protein COCNU_07G002030 [Cocos nucifera]|uniref:Uncharacterized protein n=1 Tax=Cocos nucifera TaxID=13894 RepID=A0A8K0IDN8_COCNU|nr:hypothetical protein COCNU_07G002030 [Cocos nucifera]
MDDAESADGNFLETLELVDVGDIGIRDTWKASDDPLRTRGVDCQHPWVSLPRYVHLPLQLVGIVTFHLGSQLRGRTTTTTTSSRLQCLTTTSISYQWDIFYQQQQPLHEVKQPFGFNGQPLVDNTPYDSGCSKGVEG